VLGAIAVLFGVAWLLGAMHAIHVSIEGVVALGLVFLGAAMIVTGRTDWSLSRRSWPVWLGIGLIAVLVTTSTTFGLGSAMRHVSFGNKSVAVTTNDQTVYGGFGNVTVDATGLKAGDKLTVNSIAGNVMVQLPPGADLSVNAHVLAGHVCVDGDNSNGVGAQVQHHFNGNGPNVTLDVHESFGQVTVGNQGCSQ
jgi:predicted membrane protein